MLHPERKEHTCWCICYCERHLPHACKESNQRMENSLKSLNPLHQQFPRVRHIPPLLELLSQPRFISKHCVSLFLPSFNGGPCYVGVCRGALLYDSRRPSFASRPCGCRNPVVAHEVATLEGILSCILAPWLPISWSWLTWRLVVWRLLLDG